jgi:hypothetical protein
MKSFIPPGTTVAPEPAGPRRSRRMPAGQTARGTLTRFRLRWLVVLFALVASSLPGVDPIVAASPGVDSGTDAQQGRCTTGDAQALFQAIPVAGALQLRGLSHPGLVESLLGCQYRVWGREGDTTTFCEDDVILGGIVWLSDYKAQGIPRDAAIRDIELGGDRVWLNGKEQILLRTAYKDFQHPILGLTVYQHRAFITQLPPGDYVSLWVSTYPGIPDESTTIDLHVLPRGVCG